MAKELKSDVVIGKQVYLDSRYYEIALGILKNDSMDEDTLELAEIIVNSFESNG